MTVTTSLPQSALTCGCRREEGRTVHRCAKSAELWTALTIARDDLWENERSGSRIGHKSAIDRFAAARDEYRDHIGAGA